jgi:hypothetical protein
MMAPPPSYGPMRQWQEEGEWGLRKICIASSFFFEGLKKKGKTIEKEDLRELDFSTKPP